jgi:hypothetical protein
MRKTWPVFFYAQIKMQEDFMGNAIANTSRIVWIFLTACLFFGWPVFAPAGTVSLPQTGQTICYDTDGAVVTCSGTGQDGDTRAGLPWPNPRFRSLFIIT